MRYKDLENAAYLFNRGESQKAHDFLGAHLVEVNDYGERYRFAVWAPNATRLSVVGDFNAWQEHVHYLERLGNTGIWYLEIDGLRKWQRYKFAVTGMDGYTVLKADPFARHAETRPGTASILYHEPDFPWTDGAFLQARARRPAYAEPLNIYELHLGSWRRHPDGAIYSYRDLAAPLIDYLREMGYNAVELMPLTEYPLDMSWGYQVTGYFAVTSRYGTPYDLKYLINELHAAGIRVFLDWVPAHFPKDAFALARFDGTPTYEYADPVYAEHPEWGTLVFDYGRYEVRSFLYSSADYWLSDFHFDGLRVDAVSSMIYLNYGRDTDLRNVEGGVENLEALDFLRHLNTRLKERYPGIYLIAEESTSWAGVTAEVEEGGLGFTHKWNMGWMNDILRYFKTDYNERSQRHNLLTFGLSYAFSEHFILPLSHDEVVHGKASLLQKMPGDYWRQFASLRSLFGLQMTHPGHKLSFMGNEFGPYIEWRYYEELEWFMLGYDSHRQLREFVRDLNHLYLKDPAFWGDDFSWTGFQWLQVDDRENEVYAYLRRAPKSRDKIVVLNLTPAVYPEYRLPIHAAGRYQLILNSDDRRYGGSGYLTGEASRLDSVLAAPGSEQMSKNPEQDSERQEQHYLKLKLPPLAVMIFERIDQLDSE